MTEIICSQPYFRGALEKLFDVHMRMLIRRAFARRIFLLQLHKESMPFDAFLRIRSQLESQTSQKRFPEVDRQCEAKVLTRNRECYLTERPDKSTVDYERRALHRYTGFTSLAHVPYRPFAGLKHTDAYSLIAETMDLPFQQPNHIRQVKAAAKTIICMCLGICFFLSEYQ